MLMAEISKVVRAPANGAMWPLLASCIAASKKFEVNKQTVFGNKELIGLLNLIYM